MKPIFRSWFRTRKSIVYSASFSPDGSRVVTAGSDRTAQVWDARTGLLLLTLRGHTGPVGSASFSPDGMRVVTGGGDGTARVWDAATGAENLTLKWYPGWVDSATFSPDGRRVLTAGGDGAARIWDSRAFRDTRPPDREVAPPPRLK